MKSFAQVNKLLTFDPDEGIGVIAYFVGMSLCRFIAKKNGAVHHRPYHFVVSATTRYGLAAQPGRTPP